MDARHWEIKKRSRLDVDVVINLLGTENIWDTWEVSLSAVKGTVSRDFCFWFFSWISPPPSPPQPQSIANSLRYSQVKVHYLYQWHWWPVSMTPEAKLPPVSMTSATIFSTSFASVVDTSGKFATGVKDAGGKEAFGIKFATGPVANNGNNYQTATT